MSLRTRGRGAHPGPFACAAGSVTIEFAAATAVLAMFTVLLVTGLGAVGTQLGLTALARDAARAASRGCDATSARAAAESIVRNAELSKLDIRAADGIVSVRVHRSLRLLALPQPLDIQAGASAISECPW